MQRPAAIIQLKYQPVLQPKQRHIPATAKNTTYNLLLARKQRRANAMHGCITPALIVEPARAIEVVKERRVGGPAPEIEARDLKVAPD